MLANRFLKARQEVAVGKDFFMITPLDTGKATQCSEVRVSFNDEFLFIAMIFFNNSIQGEYVVESLNCLLYTSPSPRD